MLPRFLPLLLLLVTDSLGRAQDTAPLPDAQFAKLHALIKPGPSQSRWMAIDWHPTVWEARQRAAKEGKPMFLWAGSGGAPVAGC
jgi:hypothetical protein